MIVRIRTKNGTQRITLNESALLSNLIQQIVQQTGIPEESLILSITPKMDPIDFKNQISSPLANCGIKHGDLIYVASISSGMEVDETEAPSTKMKAGVDVLTESSSGRKQYTKVKQDDIDDFLDQQDGLITRKRDPQFCRHFEKGMCDYCMPLEPYDSKYLASQNIKHMSVHSYIRSVIKPSQKKEIENQNLPPPLEEHSFKVLVPCTSGHKPWPASICTKCQPSAATLQSQSFRIVDHIEFEGADIVDHFISYWRSTGHQRLGYLYGDYKPYSEVPLGIKAVVCAIWEPPQVNGVDTLEVLALSGDAAAIEEEAKVDSFAKEMGLQKVGAIFTDLTDDGTSSGKVFYKRGGESYFLSSLECILAARLQQAHPSPSKYSTSGYFGSKFITCVISGDEKGDIAISPYQVSNMCMSMFNAGIIEPCVDPSLMRVLESTQTLYVPEIFHQYINQYNVAVKQSAKPTFPVDYLLVTLTHGFPQTPKPTFKRLGSFPIEHRTNLGSPPHLFSTLYSLLFSKSSMDADSFSDFHLAVFLSSLDILDGVSKRLIAKIAKGSPDFKALIDSLRENISWKTLQAVATEAAEHEKISSASTAQASTSSSSWHCRHCTFVNSGPGVDCNMCGLPKD